MNMAGLARNGKYFFGFLCLFVAISMTPGFGQQDSDIKILPVSGNIYMLVGDGANVTMSVGRDGILLVDTGTAAMANKLLTTVRQLADRLISTPTPVTPCVGLRCGEYASPVGWSSPAINALISSPAPPQPIRFVINTNVDPDHTGGNKVIVPAGVTYTGGNIASSGGVPEGAALIAHENVLNRMAESPAGKASDPLPTDTYHRDFYKLSHFFNGEGVQVVHVPAAHTDGDSIVYFRYSDVISAGDILSTVGYPVIDTEKGGSIQGVIAGLNRILDMGIPEFRTQGGTMVIPGHGRLCDMAEVVYYRDMLSIISDRIQDAIKRGLTLQQIKTAKLTMDFDARWGSTSGPWTTDMFIEAVYKSLSKKP